MEQGLTVTQVLMLAGAAQGFVLFVLLFFLKRGNRAANRSLAALLLIITVNIFLHALSHGNGPFNFPQHRIVVTGMFLLFGPLLYMYVTLLTSPEPLKTKMTVPHVAPFACCSLLFLFYLARLRPFTDADILLVVVSATLYVQVLIYLVLSVRRLIEHTKRMKESFSSIDQLNLRWLQWLVLAMIGIWTFAIASEFDKRWATSWDDACLLMSLFLYVIGYVGIAKPEIFANVISHNQECEAAPLRKKYESSTLTVAASDEYYEKLKTYMECEKPYLNSGLTLPDLAKRLDMPVHHLSRVINERFKQNFFEFVNSHRVSEAQRLLASPDYRNITIIAIGFESGFNSVSAFNAAFKKHVHATPSQYRSTLQLSADHPSGA